MRRIAIHEAGHIVTAAMLGLPLPVLARVASSGGFVLRDAPAIYTAGSTKKEMAYLLGGRAAEKLACGNPSSGASGQDDSDLDMATNLALSQETSWRLGENGLIYAPIAMPDRYKMTEFLRHGVNQRLVAAHDLALQTLEKHQDLLEFVAAALLKERELDQRQIAWLFTPVHEAVASQPNPQAPPHLTTG